MICFLRFKTRYMVLYFHLCFIPLNLLSRSPWIQVCLFVLFCFGHICSMQKFPIRGSNLCFKPVCASPFTRSRQLGWLRKAALSAPSPFSAPPSSHPMLFHVYLDLMHTHCAGACSYLLADSHLFFLERVQ